MNWKQQERYSCSGDEKKILTSSQIVNEAPVMLATAMQIGGATCLQVKAAAAAKDADAINSVPETPGDTRVIGDDPAACIARLEQSP